MTNECRNNCRKDFKNISFTVGRGFTLIELMVVIAIIALLSSITFNQINNAKIKGKMARSVMDIRTFGNALEMYYQVNGDWPPVGGKVFWYSDPQKGWQTLGNYLKEYMPSMIYPQFPTVVQNGYVYGGYAYFKGTEDNPVNIKILNSATSKITGCVKIKKGYYLSFLSVPEQNAMTLNDDGVDYDSVELRSGDVQYYSATECPF